MYQMCITSSRVQAVWSFQFSFPLINLRHKKGAFAGVFARSLLLLSAFRNTSIILTVRQSMNTAQTASVKVPTCENMWGVLIFLRFYFVVGQAPTRHFSVLQRSVLV